jgi:hypothetical protein
MRKIFSFILSTVLFIKLNQSHNNSPNGKSPTGLLARVKNGSWNDSKSSNRFSLLNLQQRPQSAKFANQKLLYFNLWERFCQSRFDRKISPG